MNWHQLADGLMKNNQFAQGGLLLMAVGGVLAYLRSVPMWCYYKLKDQVTMSVTITDDVDAYKWLRRWFNERPNTKKIRRVDIFIGTNGDKLILPAPGGHWTWYKHRPVYFEFTRQDEKTANSVYSQKRKEAVTLRTIGRNQQFIREFIEEVHTAYKKAYDVKPSLHIWNDSMWTEKEPYEPRELDSVLLPTGYKELLLGDIKSFRDCRDWYNHMGIPYHRGYLFYGLPGTGKTSLVTGLSSHFNSKVYILKLSEFNDRSLVEAISQVDAHSMVIMEDADCVQVVRDRNAKEDDKKDAFASLGVTLSGLLNVIDGLLTPSGVLFFMTTNHVDKLDPALIRPGRIDLKLEFGLATIQQKSELYNRFFPGEMFPLELRDTPMTMADLQGRLMLIRNERLLKGDKLVEIIPAQRGAVAEQTKNPMRNAQYAPRSLDLFKALSTPLKGETD